MRRSAKSRARAVGGQREPRDRVGDRHERRLATSEPAGLRQATALRFLHRMVARSTDEKGTQHEENHDNDDTNPGQPCEPVGEYRDRCPPTLGGHADRRILQPRPGTRPTAMRRSLSGQMRTHNADHTDTRGAVQTDA